MLRWFICLIIVLILSPINAVYAALQSPLYAGLVIRPSDGQVIYQHNANEPRHPASLTKMMTLFLVFDALKSGKIHMHTKLPISVHAARQPRTNLNLRPGTTITVREAIEAMIVHSANDAAVAVAEALSGSELNFVRMMNKKAAALGMNSSTFGNAHGLYHPEQISSATDMAKLATALRRYHPQYFPLFSKKSFAFKGKVIHSHNRVMSRYKWANGMKTGYIRASGFNVVTTTHRADGDLVAVVLGGPTAKARDDHMIALLDQAYGRIAQLKPTKRPGKAKVHENEPMLAQLDQEIAPARTRADVFLPLQQQEVAAITAVALALPADGKDRLAANIAIDKTPSKKGGKPFIAKVSNKKRVVTTQPRKNLSAAKTNKKIKLAKQQKSKNKLVAHNKRTTQSSRTDRS